MILAQEPRNILWQSSDSLMEAGSAKTSAHNPYYYASLGSRPVTLCDIKGLIHFLQEATLSAPLVLLSCCPGFQASPEEEQNGLVFYTGQYRALQQARKQAGGLVLSFIYQISVGGTYLMHGLSAQHRAAAMDTVFHDTVPGRPAVSLKDAHQRGLIDTILTMDQFPEWLENKLNKGLNSSDDNP